MQQGYLVEKMVPSQAPYNEHVDCLIVMDRQLPKESLVVKFTGQISGRVAKSKAVKCRSTVLAFRTPMFAFPESAKVSVCTERNDLQLCAYERPFNFQSNLQSLFELLHKVNDPVDFMCAAYNVKPRGPRALDTELERAFKSKMPADYMLLKGDGSTPSIEAGMCIEEFPTLLHFAACYGLCKLCETLISCPGGHRALSIQNREGMDPETLARHHGHEALYFVLSELRQNYNYKDNSNMDEIYEKFDHIYTEAPSHEEEIYEPMNLISANENVYIAMKQRTSVSSNDPSDIISRISGLQSASDADLRDGIEKLLAEFKMQEIQQESPYDNEICEPAYVKVIATPWDNISIGSGDSGVGKEVVEAPPQKPEPSKKPVPKPRSLKSKKQGDTDKQGASLPSPRKDRAQSPVQPQGNDTYKVNDPLPTPPMERDHYVVPPRRDDTYKVNDPLPTPPMERDHYVVPPRSDRENMPLPATPQENFRPPVAPRRTCSDKRKSTSFSSSARTDMTSSEGRRSPVYSDRANEPLPSLPTDVGVYSQPPRRVSSSAVEEESFYDNTSYCIMDRGLLEGHQAANSQSIEERPPLPIPTRKLSGRF